MLALLQIAICNLYAEEICATKRLGVPRELLHGDRRNICNSNRSDCLAFTGNQMANQTLTIVDTLDDGYQNTGSNFDSGTCYIAEAANPGGVSFVLTSEIPAGSTVSKTYIKLYCGTPRSGTGVTADFKFENADPATNTRWSNSHLPIGATYLTTISSISFNMGSASGFHFHEADTGGLATNLSAAVQSLVNTYGTLAVGDRINICLETAAGAYLNIEDYGAAGTNHAELYIEWTPGGTGGKPVYYFAQL